MSVSDVLRSAVAAAVVLSGAIAADVVQADVVQADVINPAERGVAPAVGPIATFTRPVDGVIISRFDHNAGAFGAGNRGVRFSAEPGEPVHSVGAGTVTFAGPVAGRTWVTVQHAGGLRSTLGPLADLQVGRGDRVDSGAQVGRATGPVLLTVREGDRYLDPEPLLGSVPSTARLVPAPP